MNSAASLTHSSSLIVLPCLRNSTLPLLRLNSFSRLQTRTTVSLRLPRRSLRLLAKATCENHSHEHHHHHNHHRHCCSVELTISNQPQKLLIEFAKATGWIRLADFLREHLLLCCSSAVLFLAAAACPFLIPKPYTKPLQDSFMIVAFPLVGISAALDAAMDIAGGKVNIHVLMALAAFASVLMGNALEGGLLLVMFNLAHIAEEFFTSRSMVDVKELKESNPDSAW